MKAIRRFSGGIIAALSYFTRIPVPSSLQGSSAELSAALPHFPLMGLLVGTLSALTYLLASLLFPPLLSLIFALAAALLTTGALHEDGWADLWDGLGGGYNRQRILEIMKDPRLGTFGVISLLFMLLIKLTSLYRLGPELIPLALLGAHPFSRGAALLHVRLLPYGGRTDLSKSAEVTRPGRWMGTVYGLAWALLPALFLFPARLPLLLIAELFLFIYFYYLLKRKIGGYTGDTLGAAQQASELLFYLLLLPEIPFLPPPGQSSLSSFILSLFR